MASPLMVPPPALKDRIMAEVEREAALLGAAGRAPTARSERRRERRGFGWLSGWRLAPVAAGLLIAGVLAGAALAARRTRTIVRDRDGRERRARGRRRQGRRSSRRTCRPRRRAASTRCGCSRATTRPQPTDVAVRAALRRLGGRRHPRLGVHDVDQVLVTDEPPAAPTTPTGELLIVGRALLKPHNWRC